MKRSKRNRARWPYWAKALRNLLFALGLLAVVWDVLDMPPPGHLAFRRLERQALAPPSEIIADVPTGDLLPFSSSITIGLTEDWAAVGTPYRISNALSSFHLCPLAEGPNLICLRQSVIRHDEAGQPLSHAAYAALRPPAGSASAVLTLHNEDGSYTAEGVLEEAIFLFFFRPEDVSAYNHLIHPAEYTYELTFFDESGGSIQKTAG